MAVVTERSPSLPGGAGKIKPNQEYHSFATVAEILAQVKLDLHAVRHLLKQQLLLLTPAS